ncbi:MAG: enolase C-terminal domain-like protein, partial [Myxococcota bacterium]
AAAFAIETALWDVWAQRRSMPLACVWGAPADARVSTAMLVDVLSPDDWPSSPPAVVKMKVGRPGRWDEELSSLRQWHARFADATVRLDANRAFGPEAPARLHDLHQLQKRGLDIDFLEEPTPWPWPVTSLPLAQDESLRKGVLCEGMAAAVVKPTVLGGLAAGDRWRADGHRVVMSHTFEGPVAHAALSAWALAFAPNETAGLGPHAGVFGWRDVVVDHVEGERLRVPSRPGLGLLMEAS